MKEVHQCSSCGGFCKKSGCERENDPPLVKFAKTAHLPPLPDPTMEASTLITAGGVFGAMFAVDQMLEYGALCRKQALEEAHAWMMQRHEAQKHRDNYMLVEANRFKKELLTLPRVEQCPITEQIKPDSAGEVIHTVV